MAKFFWHNLKIKEVIRILRTNVRTGLAEKEAALSLKEFGKNELPEKKPLSKLSIFFEQFQSPLVYILVIGGFISLLFEELTDAIVIFGAVFLNVIVGYMQESKASNTLGELKKVVRHKAEVLRDGNLKIIDSEELVPGDIIILNPGDKVPADARVIESQNLKVNEMALTGEWLAAEKEIDVLKKDTSLADRDNMVYMGTTIEDGKGKAVVTQTGIETEIGKIALLVKETPEEKTPYQKKLARFSLLIGLIIAVICVAIFIEGIIGGRNPEEMFITAIAVAVAAIPEGLPVAMTVILALGMQKVLEKRGLIRKLTSAETLGSTSVICTDKTGTLTEGKMKVDKIVTAFEILDKKKDKDLEFLALKIASLTSEAFVENIDSPKEEWILRGRPTDKALLEAGIEKKVLKRAKEKNIKKIIELPFNPVNKFIAAVFIEGKKESLYICGAPEKILEKCKFYQTKQKKVSLNKEILKNLEIELKRLAGAGLRVVATGYKKVKKRDLPVGGNSKNLQKEINNLSFTGFITLKDPIRKEAKKAIRTCSQAGMRTILATGDHKLTAKSIAREIGLKVKEHNVLEGKELDKLSDKEFEKILDNIKIYARVEPKHKSRIIGAWQKRGEVVAMTGDGINDAPALKKADIGVALGSGTEVAKETADLILLDNSFSIIVKAVQEGRAILDNIRKVITYLLSDSFTEVILIGVGIFAGFPLPITAIQILWVNLIEDGLPDIALAFEPEEEDLMKLKPTAHKVSLLTREMRVIIFLIGIITDFILLGLFFWLHYTDHEVIHVQTMIFACLTIDSLFYALSCKSLRRNLWHINPFSNKLLIISLIIGISMLVLAIYNPFFQMFLKTVPLSSHDWITIIGLGIMELVFLETTKWYFITRHQLD